MVMMDLKGLLLGAAALLLLPHGPAAVLGRSAAAFTTDFANVTQGWPLRLAWETVDPKYYPLAISARLINRTLDNRANGSQMNLTTHINNGSSWTWDGVPYPLPYAANGLYRVEIRPATWNAAEAEPGTLGVPMLAHSNFFTIGEDNSSQSKPGQIVPGNDNTPTGPNKTVALGVGVSIGVSSVIALIFIGQVLRKRRRRILDEKRRRKRFEVIIN